MTRISTTDAVFTIADALRYLYCDRCTAHYIGHDDMSTADQQAVALLESARRELLRELRS
jgi:hypothetical protein